MVEGGLPAPDDITIVVCAKNEEETLGAVLAAAAPFAAEILVVDGHSTDATARIAEDAGAQVFRDHGRGKGDAIRCAVPHIRTALTVFLDADGSHAPEDIPRLVSPIQESNADHVTASRLLGGSSELHGGFSECFRLMGSSFITACINARFKVRLSDSQNGFRAIRTDVLRALDLRENITTIEQEMIIKSLLLGYRMREVPSHEFRRKGGVSKIRLWHVCHRYGWSLVKYGWLTRRSQAGEPAGTEA